MSLLEDMATERKARLARLGAPSPFQAKIIRFEPPVNPQHPAEGWDGMWFYDLIFGDPVTIQPTIKSIQSIVSERFFITVSDLNSARRTHREVIPRQIAMYLAHHLTRHSYPEIGRRFGGRDHSTVHHACRKIATQIEIDAELAGVVSSLRRFFL